MIEKWQENRNYYYADYNGSHSTLDYTFQNDEEAIDYFLKNYSNVEAIYNANNDDEIWRADKQ